MAVSPHSSLVIDEFIYDPNSRSGSKLVMNVALGTVRYASGNIAKLNRQNVDIRTPTARIGVRGTAFSMTVDEIGKSLVILLPNADGTVGEIEVESGAGIVILRQAFQATTVGVSEAKPSKPVILGGTGGSGGCFFTIFTMFVQAESPKTRFLRKNVFFKIFKLQNVTQFAPEWRTSVGMPHSLSNLGAMKPTGICRCEHRT